MTVVGPRPPLRGEWDCDEAQRRELALAPGVTNCRQVGRCPQIRDYDYSAALDLQYTARPSAWFDLKILGKTVAVVPSGRLAS